MIGVFKTLFGTVHLYSRQVFVSNEGHVLGGISSRDLGPGYGRGVGGECCEEGGLDSEKPGDCLFPYFPISRAISRAGMQSVASHFSI
jgi:hypothetical protein